MQNGKKTQDSRTKTAYSEGYCNISTSLQRHTQEEHPGKDKQLTYSYLDDASKRRIFSFSLSEA